MEPTKAQGVWQHPWARAYQKSGGWNVWLSPFGLLGPLVSSAIWMVFIIAGLWALKLLNIVLQSAFVNLLFNSVLGNLQWFLAASLAIGYIEFFSRRFPPSGLALWPLANAIGATFSAWIVAWIFRAVGTLAGVGVLSQIGISLRANLAPVFVLFLALGFIAVGGRRKAWRQ